MKLALLVVIGVGLVFGFAALKVFAAREVSRGDFGEFMRALMWTGWMHGSTRKARVLRTLALVWLAVAVLAWVVIAIGVD